MAGSKLASLVEITTPADDDLLYLVNDPAGVPADRKISVSNLLPTDAEILASVESESGRDMSADGAVVDSIPSLINPLALSQGVNLTAADSGSNGIQVANNDDINFGTGDFTLVWVGSLPDLSVLINPFFMYQYIDSSNWFYFNLRNEGASYPLTLQLQIKIAGTLVIDAISALPVDFADNEYHTISASVDRDDSVRYYIDGRIFSVVAISGDLSSDVVLPALFVSGTSTTRTASTTLAAYAYNYALDADQQKDLARNGVAMSDRDGSMTELVTNGDDWIGASGTTLPTSWSSSGAGTPTLTVSDLSAVSNFDTTTLTYIADGVLALYQTFVVESGKQYKIRFSYRCDSASNYIFVGTTSTKIYLQNTGLTGDAVSVDLLIVSSGTSVGIQTITPNSTIQLSSISLIKTGTTLRLEPENIQLSPGQWLDAANNHHAKLPAEGASLIRPQTSFEIRWTNTWAGTNELQYIGGVNESILPENAFIEKIIGTIDGTVIEDIIVGDGVDNDRFVEITTGLTTGTKPFTIAEPTTDGTNYDLTVTPDAAFTGSITWTITGITLEA